MDSVAVAAMYELMGLSFTCPDLKLSELISSGEYEDAFDEISQLVGVGDDVRAAFSLALAPFAGKDAVDVRHELRVEHSRLFVAMPHTLIPYSEGLWLEVKEGREERTLIVNKYTLAIEAFMKSCGVFTAKSYNDAIDNIFCECDFMQYLLLTESFPEDFEMTPREAYERFLREHIAVWVPEFCQQIIDETTAPFYRVLALAMKQFVAWQLAQLDAAS